MKVLPPPPPASPPFINFISGYSISLSASLFASSPPSRFPCNHFFISFFPLSFIVFFVYSRRLLPVFLALISSSLSFLSSSLLFSSVLLVAFPFSLLIFLHLFLFSINGSSRLVFLSPSCFHPFTSPSLPRPFFCCQSSTFTLFFVSITLFSSSCSFSFFWVSILQLFSFSLYYSLLLLLLFLISLSSGYLSYNSSLLFLSLLLFSPPPLLPLSYYYQSSNSSLFSFSPFSLCLLCLSPLQFFRFSTFSFRSYSLSLLPFSSVSYLPCYHFLDISFSRSLSSVSFLCITSSTLLSFYLFS